MLLRNKNSLVKIFTFFSIILLFILHTYIFILVFEQGSLLLKSIEIIV